MISNLGNFSAVCIGCSAGGLTALKLLLSSLPADFPLPIVIINHIPEETPSLIAPILSSHTHLEVLEASANQIITSGRVYTAPEGYHLLVEDEGYFALSDDQKVCFCRPSIDVTFDSMANCYGANLIGIVLTGGNSDGALGLKTIRDEGGIGIVQSPETAEVDTMPRKAIEIAGADFILPINGICEKLLELTRK